MSLSHDDTTPDTLVSLVLVFSARNVIAPEQTTGWTCRSLPVDLLTTLAVKLFKRDSTGLLLIDLDANRMERVVLGEINNKMRPPILPLVEIISIG